ncbi:hypothetical protein [Leifsonia sp. Leaf264]|uniref:hypothetical protein n=1 Tax=Leifsonia sp. Leaf264 TaxID=1736314 RepID=UPI00070008FE|nr:hypothetical protein [Leifsonia sp. Leaf264]KQO98911.1 hypothetical protein ASF30_12685 [Leifsonia sp. Leaf264]
MKKALLAAAAIAVITLSGCSGLTDAAEGVTGVQQVKVLGSAKVMSSWTQLLTIASNGCTMQLTGDATEADTEWPLAAAAFNAAVKDFHAANAGDALPDVPAAAPPLVHADDGSTDWCDTATVLDAAMQDATAAGN